MKIPQVVKNPKIIRNGNTFLITSSLIFLACSGEDEFEKALTKMVKNIIYINGNRSTLDIESISLGCFTNWISLLLMLPPICPQREDLGL
jgi:hypothetical protein